jgi:hypothetical protein
MTTTATLRSLRLLLPCLIAAVAACGDDASGGADAGAGVDAALVPDAAPAADAAPPIDAAPPAPVYGRIRLVEGVNAYGPYGGATAQLTRGALASFHQVTQDDGTCRLLELVPAFCEAWCDGVCVATNVCQPWPTWISAGDLSFAGLKEAGVGLAFDGYQYYAPQVIPAELFDPGDAVSVSAPGAEAPAFTLPAPGVATLQAAITNDEITLANGADHTFTWTPAGVGDARVRLTINANNAGHGAPYAAIIECDTADTGSVTIPRAMIEAFPETTRWEYCAGSDCPFSFATRYTRGTAATAGGGELELVVGSERAFWVRHGAL